MDKAILIVSFGTSFKETREKTICALEKDLREAFPDRKFYRAWTSNRIIKKVKETEGLEVYTLDEAIEQMKADGIKDILVQPTHMMYGYENARLAKLLEERKDDFDRIALGLPMLMSEEDIDFMSEAVLTEYEEVKAGEAALVLMGHGSPGGPDKSVKTPDEDPNKVYRDQEESFHKLGYSKVFVGTVEAVPTVEDVLASLKRDFPAPGKVYLAPYLIVAGDHATNDMAGDDPDSWKNLISALGYDVVPVIKGLGEYSEVRKRFVEHAREARCCRSAAVTGQTRYQDI